MRRSWPPRILWSKIHHNRNGSSYDLGAVGNLGDKDSFRVVVYTDTDLSDGTEPSPIAVSNNYRVYNKEKPDVVGDKFNYTKFTVLSSEDTVIHFDNFHHYKCKEDYSPIDTEENDLFFNVEDILAPLEWSLQLSLGHNSLYTARLDLSGGVFW